MPTYTNRIPDSPRGPALPIRRTPAYSALVAIVTAEDLVGCYTHYYHGRTVPCELPNCPAHDEGIPYRWHAYMSAYDVKSALHFIFEVTAAGAEPFIEYRDHHGSLRGCLFQARRLHNRPNGRLLIQTKPANLKEVRVPKAPDLTKCLAILWNLPTPTVKNAGRDPQRKTDIVIHDPDTNAKGIG